MKKHITLLLCLVLMVSLLAGCSTGGETSDGNSGVSQQDGEKTVITFWNGFTGTDGDVLKEIVAERL